MAGVALQPIGGGLHHPRRAVLVLHDALHLLPVIESHARVDIELLAAFEFPVGEPGCAEAIDLVAADHLPGVKRPVESVAEVDHVRGVVDEHRDDVVLPQDLGQGQGVPFERPPFVERIAEATLHQVVAGRDRRERGDIATVENDALAGELIQDRRVDPIIAVGAHVVVAPGVVHDEDDVQWAPPFCG